MSKEPTHPPLGAKKPEPPPAPPPTLCERDVSELASLAGTKRGGSMSIQQAMDFHREHNPNEMRKTDVRIALAVLAGAVESYRLADERRDDQGLS